MKNYDRKGRHYDIAEILSKIVPVYVKDRYSEVDFDGDIIRMNSQRYQVFSKGTKCISCGLEASYFVKEKDKSSERYHFNLYGLRGNEEVLFTKDHITPKSKGGSNRLENFQTMCYLCNHEKDDGKEKD